MKKLQRFIRDVDNRAINMGQMLEASASEEQCHARYDVGANGVAWGDVDDCQLGPVKIRQARIAESGLFTKMRVDEKFPKQKRRDITGREPVKIRWVVANKQDETNPKYRSRFVATYVQCGSDPGLYDTTLPVDALPLLTPLVAIAILQGGKATSNDQRCCPRLF